MQRILIIIGIFVAILAAVPVQAQQQDIKIIAHASLSINSISKADLARIFFKRSDTWPSGENAKPIDQHHKSEIRKTFSSEVLGRSVQEMDSYWQGQVFSGRKSPPPTFKSDQEVLNFVRATPGAVGYVSASATVSGIKMLTVVD